MNFSSYSSLLLNRNSSDFCMLILYLEVLLSYLVESSFSLYKIVSLFLPFLFHWVAESRHLSFPRTICIHGELIIDLWGGQCLGNPTLLSW